ncbi:hypothetical protein BGX27_003431, partial [Mortierella sp. AM989]
GDTGLEASKEDRVANEATHANNPTSTQATPRKVDFKIVVSLVKAKQWTQKSIVIMNTNHLEVMSN